MYTPLLIICLALGGIGWAVRRKSPRLGQVFMGLSVAGCLGLTVWRTLDTLGTAGVQRTHRGQAAVAYTLANQFLKDHSGRKGDIILIFPPNSEAPTAALDSFYEGYARVMARFRPIKLKEVTMDVRQDNLKQGHLDAKAFNQILSDHPDALAFVSWVGFPREMTNFEKLQSTEHPPIYIYNPSTRTNWSDTLALNAVRAIAIEKPASDHEAGSKTQAMTPPEVFAQTYLLLTK